MILLALTAVVRLLRLAFVASEAAFLRGMMNGEPISLSAAHASDDRVAVVSGLVILLLLATAIAWCIWQHRAQRNLHDLGRAGLRFTPGWAAGWWFVPVANLFMPFLSVRELWKASAPLGDGSAWPRTATWPVIGWWWVSWIAAKPIGWIARFMRTSDDPHAVVVANYWWMASSALSVIAAILAILVVRSVIERQKALMTLEAGVAPVPLMPVMMPPAPPPAPR
jgi:hypothetical protein